MRRLTLFRGTLMTVAALIAVASNTTYANHHEEKTQLDIAGHLVEAPPGLEKKGEAPQGLEKQGKVPHGWTHGKKRGWHKDIIEPHTHDHHPHFRKDHHHPHSMHGKRHGRGHSRGHNR